MNNISTVTGCVACGACVSICPEKAITMDTSGLFYYPQVANSICIECGLCITRCPVNSSCGNTSVISAYGGWYNNTDIVLQSSSGGAFYGMARHVLDNGGIVFGASFSQNFKVVEYHSTDEVPLGHLQKSKYVESLIGDSFLSVQSVLNTGRSVLFCGTPCHTAGLRSFLGQTYENLITCDFACGGLPSHAIFQSYLNALESKYKSKIISVDFRPKTHGWKRHAILVEFANGICYNRLGSEDDYLRSFLYSKTMLRDNCLSCAYSKSHAADITIADFWRHGELSTLNNQDGISLILCNTEKGDTFFQSISSQFTFEQLDPAVATYNNTEKVISINEQQCHDNFLMLYKEAGLSSACRHYFPKSIMGIVKKRLARHLYRR